MAVKEILLYPDSRLKEVCAPIGKFDDSVRQLLQDLVDTMVDAGHSVGIAAPQIGDTRRALVVDVSGSKLGQKQKNHGLLQMVNPEIIEREGEQLVREGCMSVPDYTGNVTRAERILVQFLNRDGEFQVIRSEGFEAIAIQHELDHLNGYLFLDRVSSLKTDLFRRKQKHAPKRAVQAQPAPYKCHLFVCINDREGERKSCADGSSPQLRLKLKERLQEKGLLAEGVRVSQSKCLGLCGEGPNVLVYPQNLWYSAVTPGDVERIVGDVEKLLN